MAQADVGKLGRALAGGDEMRKKIPTWRLESLAMATVLGGVVLFTDSGWLPWVGAAAVYLTSRHMSVADRLREKEQLGLETSVHCVSWLERYWVGKEILWAVYFVALEAWPALVGVALFIAYPYWRRWYRRRWPANR